MRTRKRVRTCCPRLAFIEQDTSELTTGNPTFRNAKPVQEMYANEVERAELRVNPPMHVAAYSLFELKRQIDATAAAAAMVVAQRARERQLAAETSADAPIQAQRRPIPWGVKLSIFACACSALMSAELCLVLLL